MPSTEPGDSWSEEAKWPMKVKQGFGAWKQAIPSSTRLDRQQNDGDEHEDHREIIPRSELY